MPFKPGISGNPLGRIPKKEKETPRQIRNKELLLLLRKLKPLQSKAVATAGQILMSEDATESGKLRASALIIQTYKDLVKEVYSDTKEPEDTDPDEIEDSKPAPLFSLKMLDSDKTEE